MTQSGGNHRAGEVVLRDESMTTALTRYEADQLGRIKALKAEEPGVVSRALGLFTMPLAWLAQKAIPAAAVQGALDFSNLMARHLTDVNDVLRDAGVSTVEELRGLELEQLDRLADGVHSWAVGVAAAEGAATGALGLPGMAADIPVVITLALRTIHKIGVCYGYQARDERDAQFIYGVLSWSGANSMKEKVASLGFLRTLEVALMKQTWKAMNEKAVATRLSHEGALILGRNLAKQLGVNLTRRKALAIIPVIGAVVGGSANGWWMKEVGWAARRAFQERWLLDAGKVAAEPEDGGA
jgi:uncharacterized protein (DUF697 family)